MTLEYLSLDFITMSYPTGEITLEFFTTLNGVVKRDFRDNSNLAKEAVGLDVSKHGVVITLKNKMLNSAGDRGWELVDSHKAGYVSDENKTIFDETTYILSREKADQSVINKGA